MGEHSYNDMGGVMKLTYNVRKFSPGPLLVWAKNAKSFTVTKVSKEELEKLCEKCAKLNKSDYTGESWAQLEAQLKKCPRTFSTNGYFRKSDGKGDCRFE